MCQNAYPLVTIQITDVIEPTPTPAPTPADPGAAGSGGAGATGGGPLAVTGTRVAGAALLALLAGSGTALVGWRRQVRRAAHPHRA